MIAPWTDERLAVNGKAVMQNFADWFGSSKVKDALDQPMVVYHGTRPGNNIEAFDMHSSGQDGIYFTPDPLYAQAYTCALFDQDDAGASGPMYPVYLSIDKPYVVTALDDSQAWEDFVYRALNRNELIEQGFNGAILRDAANGEIDQIIVFYPDQIKSAIANSGLYLKGNPSLTDQDAALTLRNTNKTMSDLNQQLAEAAENGDSALCEDLLARGADPNYQDGDDRGPLHGAARNGHAGACLILLSHGADVNLKTSTDLTALHFAANNGHTEVCRILLAHDADINATNEEGDTALHRSSASNQPEVFLTLLDHGADLDLKNHHGQTAIEIAHANRVESIPAALRAREAKQVAMDLLEDIQWIKP